jgi:inner membrane protein
MDSVTQAALGAAVAHAGWHAPLKRRSLLWGAALGTLPDLDVIAFPWMDAVERLYWHRGASHGWLFILLASAGIAFGLRRMYRGDGLTWTRAFIVTFLVLATHVAIDLFTVYGTQILAPFSKHGFGTNNLFIIDPLYTLPLLLGIAIAAFAGAGRWGPRANLVGLLLSTAYVLWSFASQARAEAVFNRALRDQGVKVYGAQTSATPFNTVLWRHLAKVEGGFLVGYWSWFDADENVAFTFVPRRPELVSELTDTRAFKVVDWFSQGYWTAQPRGEAVQVSDLRFGETRPRPAAPPDEWQFIFSWIIGSQADDPSGLQPAAQTSDRRQALPMIWRRLRGDKSAW